MNPHVSKTDLHPKNDKHIFFLLKDHDKLQRMLHNFIQIYDKATLTSVRSILVFVKPLFLHL